MGEAPAWNRIRKITFDACAFGRAIEIGGAALMRIVICGLSFVLAGCNGLTVGGSLPFLRSPLDTGSTTIWSVDLHIGDSPDRAMLEDIHNRLHAGMIRIYYDVSIGDSFYDELVANAAAARLTVDFITPYPAPPYDPVAYGKAAGVAAARYAGKKFTWELINEPDYYVAAMTQQQCIAVEIAAAKAIRAADPSATILTGGTSGKDSNNGFPYAIAVGQALAPYVTGVGLHPYGVAPSAFPSAVALLSIATKKPAYITEWSTTDASDLMEAMIASRGFTRMFDAYDYENEPGDPDYGLIDNGLWSNFAREATY